MSLKDYIKNNLNADYAFMLDGALNELSGMHSNGVSISSTIASGSFAGVGTGNVFGGAFRAFGSTDYITKENGLILTEVGRGSGRVQNINEALAAMLWRNKTYGLIVAARCYQREVPSSIYEQGGGSNNTAIINGINGVFNFQAADKDEPFLIAKSKFFGKEGKPYVHQCIWQYHDQHGGTGNRVVYYINGVLQEVSEKTGTATFPNQTGDICVGNTNDNLQSFNGSTMAMLKRKKDINGLIYSLAQTPWTQQDLREYYERTSYAQHEIKGTQAEQQAQLNALSGTTFDFNIYNVALRIYQATDQTGGYSLELDNLVFDRNLLEGDIDAQFIGSNDLTLINKNGSNLSETSVPPEFEETFNGSVLVCGGGLVIGYERQLTLTSLKPNTKIYLFHKDLDPTHTDYEIDSKLVTNGEYSHNYLHTQDVNVVVRIIELGTNFIELDMVLTNQDKIIPINQQIDRVYENK